MTAQTLGQIARAGIYASLKGTGPTKKPFDAIWKGAMEDGAAAVARECIRIMQARADGYKTAMADKGHSSKFLRICARNARILEGTIGDIEALIAEGKDSAAA